MSLGQPSLRPSFGLPRWLLERVWQLEHAFERARASGKAALLELRTDPRQITPAVRLQQAS